MEQYARKFYDLSKYATHRDERELAMKFFDGLSSRICMLVAGHCCDTVDKAIVVDTSIEPERGLFLAEQQSSGKGKSPMLVRSQSASVGGASSSGSGPFKRVKNWVRNSFGGGGRQQQQHQFQQQRQ